MTVEAVERPPNDAIDAAYRAKDGNSQYLSPVISARSRAATIRIKQKDI